MKTLLLFASNHGSTQKVAQMIINGIGQENVTIINLKKTKNPDLSEFERIIIGGSIHAGNIQKCVKSFINKTMVTLLEKQIALYLCCMDEKAEESQFNNAFPQILRSHAIATKCVGREFNFDKMNFIEKALIKKIVGITESVSKIDESRVNEFIREIKAL